MLMKSEQRFFRAGCDSRPAVSKQSASAKVLIRCDSGTDSKVWMEEDIILRILRPECFLSAHFLLNEVFL